MSRANERGWLTACAASLALAACAPTANRNLVAAEIQLRSAEADPTVVERAAVPLHDAHESVVEAQSAFNRGEKAIEVDHLAYLASRRVEIARAIAARNVATGEVEELGRERAEVVLDARTAEAENARAELGIAREETEIAREEAGIAREEAAASALTAEGLAGELSALEAKQTARGLVVTLGGVLFDVDRSELKMAAMQDLERLAQLLNAEPGRKVLIEGHTDSTGRAEYNDVLSRQRAESVGSALIRDGIAPSRITTHGFGESSPLATNVTSAGRQENRRVEIVLE